MIYGQMMTLLFVGWGGPLTPPAGCPVHARASPTQSRVSSSISWAPRCACT